MEDLRVADIMERDVVTIGPRATIRELAQLLADNGISGVPVVDDEGNLLGIVSEGDLVVQDADLHFPHYLQFLDSVVYLESVRKFEERFRKAFGAKVEDVMTAEVTTVSPNADVRTVATLMADNEVNRIPVLEGDRVVGIVTRHDVVRAIAGLRKDTGDDTLDAEGAADAPDVGDAGPEAAGDRSTSSARDEGAE